MADPNHPGHTRFLKFFSGVMSGLSLGTCVPNFKSIALIFNDRQIYGGHVTLATPPSSKTIKSHVGTPWEHAFASTFKSV